MSVRTQNSKLVRRAIAVVATIASIGLLSIGCDSSDTAGFQCDSDDECDDGFECLEHQTGAICSEGSCGCDYRQSICTQSCSSDDDCPDDMACNHSSSCGGPSDLCGRA